MINNQVYTEFGYSQTGIVSEDWETMFDDARYNAYLKVLYREGYVDIDCNNYEVEVEKLIDGWDIINYTFIYPPNNYRNLNVENDGRGNKIIRARRNDGRIKYAKKRENKKDVIKEYNQEFELRER